jgi:hypothetical protein
LVATPDAFFKFPRTPHLWWPLSRPPKDDRVLGAADVEEFLSGDVVVEEKVDGANIGLSLDENGAIGVQNRGSWIGRGAHSQFQPIWSWIAQRQPALANAVQNDRILFGEWCFAVHSVRYDRLPDWFLGFDIYDRTARRFWSTARRNTLLERAGISRAPTLYSGRIALPDLKRILKSEHSRVGTGPLEGLYIRREGPEWLEARAKLVRPEFLTAIDEHWSGRPLETNQLMAIHGTEPVA